MARFENGWIKTYRKAYESDIYDNPFLIAIWESFLKMASWKEQKKIINGKQRILPPGTVIFGMKELSQRWSCSTKTIHKWVHYLKMTDRIALEAGTGGCIATICNWEEYQGFDDDGVTPSKSEVNTKETPSKSEVKHIKEGKKVRKKEYIYPSAFENLYLEYPKRGGKAGGYVRYQREVTTPEIHDKIFQALTRYKRICVDERREAKHIKSFEVFMNQWRNFDEEDVGQLNLPQPNKADEQARLMALLD